MSKASTLEAGATLPGAKDAVTIDMDVLAKVFGDPPTATPLDSEHKTQKDPAAVPNNVSNTNGTAIDSTNTNSTNNSTNNNNTNNNNTNKSSERRPSDLELLSYPELPRRDSSGSEPENGHPSPPLASPEVDLDEHKLNVDDFEGIDDGLVEPLPSKDTPVLFMDGDEEGKEGQEGEQLEPDESFDDGAVSPRFGGDDDGNDQTQRGALMPPKEKVDMNSYQQKKNLAQGMMDLALLSANANQLRYVIESTPAGHNYYYPSIVMISLSLLLQVAVGVGLIMNGRLNVNHDHHLDRADVINDVTVVGVFLITIVNVFITSFGVAPTNPST